MSKLIQCRERVQVLLFQLETLEASFLAAKQFRERLLAGEREFTTDDVQVVLQLGDRPLALPTPSAAELTSMLEAAAAATSDTIRETWDAIVTAASEAQTHYEAAAVAAAGGVMPPATFPATVNSNDGR
jgi:hypothetical protein